MQYNAYISLYRLKSGVKCALYSLCWTEMCIILRVNQASAVVDRRPQPGKRDSSPQVGRLWLRNDAEA